MLRNFETSAVNRAPLSMPDVMPAPAADRFQDPAPALILATLMLAVAVYRAELDYRCGRIRRGRPPPHPGCRVSS